MQTNQGRERGGDKEYGASNLFSDTSIGLVRTGVEQIFSTRESFMFYHFYHRQQQRKYSNSRQDPDLRQLYPIYSWSDFKIISSLSY